MYQSITIAGNLGQDPEMRYTAQGIAVTTFTVAVNEKYGEKESVTWFRVSCWRQLAELTSTYLVKGRQVLVSGRVQARAYVGRDGQPACSLELTADTVKFLGSGTNTATASAATPESTAAPDAEDLPF